MRKDDLATKYGTDEEWALCVSTAYGIEIENGKEWLSVICRCEMFCPMQIG